MTISATTSVELEEEERQMVLLALAQLSLINPGFDHFLNTIACKMDNVDERGRGTMFEGFRQTRQKEPRWGVYDHYKKEWVTEEQPWEGSYTQATGKCLNMDDKGGRRFYEVHRLPEKPGP